jgi:hypothetical protein
MTNPSSKSATLFAIALAVAFASGCSRTEHSNSSTVEASSTVRPNTAAEGQQAEPKSQEDQFVEPQVQSEIEKLEMEKRATLLKDAQSALEETRNALAALDKGDKNGALSALERASGKLDLVVSRDPKLAFAPIDVSTTVLDLYATPDTVKRVVNVATLELSGGQVQQARHLVTGLASEADTQVVAIPLATYPAAIKAVAPLIDGGKTQEAEAALEAALHTLVIETDVIPLPRVRAEALLRQAEQLTSKANGTQVDNQKVTSLIDAARTEIQLAEALGYGTKDDYKPLYAQLDEVQKKTASGNSSKGLFDRIDQSLKKFKFSS